MRTTLAIADDVLKDAQAIARARRVSLGKVVTELLRRGLELELGERDGFPVFRVPPGVRSVTSDAIRTAEDDL